MKLQFRQGDVLLCAIHRIPPIATPARGERGRVILAEGELSGHAHAFPAAQARMFREKQSRRTFLAIAEGGGHLQHEEHEAIAVPRGVYEVVRQREYSPRAVRRVRD